MTSYIDAIEALAKAATPGPWEDLSKHPFNWIGYASLIVGLVGFLAIYLIGLDTHKVLKSMRYCLLALFAALIVAVITQ